MILSLRDMREYKRSINLLLSDRKRSVGFWRIDTNLFSLLKFNRDLSRKSSQVLKDKWILAVQRLSVATRLITLLVAQQLNCTRWKYANAWYNFYVYLLRLAIKKNVVQLWNGIENSSLPRSHNCIGFRREGNVSPKVSMFTVTHTTYSMGIKSFLNERL